MQTKAKDHSPAAQQLAHIPVHLSWQGLRNKYAVVCRYFRNCLKTPNLLLRPSLHKNKLLSHNDACNLNQNSTKTHSTVGFDRHLPLSSKFGRVNGCSRRALKISGISVLMFSPYKLQLGFKKKKLFYSSEDETSEQNEKRPPGAYSGPTAPMKC